MLSTPPSCNTMSEECPVCYEPESAWEGSTKAKCGHAICMQCFLEWTVVKRNMTCPMCRGNVRASRPQEPEEEEDYSTQPRPDEWDWTIQARRYREQQDRYEAHQVQLRASALRRRQFLLDQQDSYREHCDTCTDRTCILSHRRQWHWLMERGKLVPLPPQIKNLDRLVLGYMLNKDCMTAAKRYRIEGDIRRRFGLEPPSKRRIEGLLKAIRGQQSTKQCSVIHRQGSKGSVALRLTDHAAGLPAIVAELQTKRPEVFVGPQLTTPNFNVKCFKGHTPPKRRARVGDIHQRTDGIRGMCVGWNLWSYSDGARVHLAGKEWVSCV
jgi:hypothetical protein